MPQPPILDYLATHYPLTEAFRSTLKTATTRRTYHKGHILEKNRRFYSIWFLDKGLAKGQYFDQNGREHITRFWREGEIMLLTPKTSTVSPVTDQIVLLESCVLTSIDAQLAIQLYETFMEGPKLASKILLSDSKQADLKSHLCALPAIESYQQFQLHYPAERIPLKDIAGYLEITPSTLSETRRKLL